MTDAQRQAHLALLAKLPTRTHHCIAPVSRAGRPPPIFTKKLKAAILALAADGLNRHQIAQELGVAYSTACAHLKDWPK